MAFVNSNHQLDAAICQQARLTRDARFDGVFFTGVLTTGIYCRSVCPAVAPKEQNVKYYMTAIEAATAGLRPCLRCRPDSAPQSNAWKGTKTTLERALRLIDDGVLSKEYPIGLSGVEILAERLGISSRYLRRLFVDGVGMPPKRYALYRQLMFAKQLLHQTELSVTHIAFASGFKSIRRFNEVFAHELKLTPSAIRKGGMKTREDEALHCTSSTGLSLALILEYRPKMNWQHLLDFYQRRAVEGMEAVSVEQQTYGRSFEMNGTQGYFEFEVEADKNRIKLELQFSGQSTEQLLPLITNIRRMLDLDADILKIENCLQQIPWLTASLSDGIRIPGTWSTFEAGCRAILGQQVSVEQAVKLLNVFVTSYGEPIHLNGKEMILFPRAEVIAEADLTELKMPNSRRDALRALAQHVSLHPESPVDSWLEIKGIGPWTVAYTKLRGIGDADIFLTSDLVIKNQLLSLAPELPEDKDLKKKAYPTLSKTTAALAAPWGSYLTMQLWHQA